MSDNRRVIRTLLLYRLFQTVHNRKGERRSRYNRLRSAGPGIGCLGKCSPAGRPLQGIQEGLQFFAFDGNIAGSTWAECPGGLI